MADASAHLQQLKIQCTKKKTVKILLGLLLAGVILIVVVAIVVPNNSQQHVSELKENTNNSKEMQQELQTMLTTRPDFVSPQVSTATAQATTNATTLTITSMSTESSFSETPRTRQDIKHLLNNKKVTWNFLEMQLKTSCSAIHTRHPDYASGVYTIYLDGGAPGRSVWCDMETDGGGWTRFQHRPDRSVDFNKSWASYQQGFGSPEGGFWLGNDDLHRLTLHILSELRVELWDWDGRHGYAQYSTFKVSSVNHNYTLTVGGYSGTIGDSLANHNRRQFTTTDRDNDRKRGVNCANYLRGAGWWFNRCHHANLNGRYLGSRNNGCWCGISWQHWQNHTKTYSYKATAMLVRPRY